MKRNIIISFFILAFSYNLSAQNPFVKQWDYRFGGTDNEFLFSFQQTVDGGYILGGYSSSGISGDKTQAKWGGSDYWIVKIDALGNKQWDKDFGGTHDDGLTSLEQTADRGYILGGWSKSNISGNKTQNTWGNYDYWIVKVDSLGIKQWDKDFGGTGDDYLYSLQQTTDGGYILGGFSYSNISGDKTQNTWGFYDYWIIKIDSLGNKQWDKDFGGTDIDELFSLQQTVDGGYILGGYSYSNISGDKTQNTWGANDYWVIKIDSFGNKQWDKGFGGTDNDWLNSLRQTTDGGYILGGRSASGISGDKTQNIWGNWDYWIVKIDSLGNKQWDKDFGGTNNEELYEILLMDDGGYLLSGDSYSPISGNKTEANLGFEQTWIVKTDSLGNMQWDKTIFTPGNDETGLTIQSKDGCYIIANFSNGGILGYKTQLSWGGYDYWIIKFCDSSFSVPPVISLASSDTSFCQKNCINFFDLSINNPTSWQWFFPGAQPDTSSLQNPTNICYNAYGSFDVTLIACNAAGCDSLVMHNFINEYQNPVDSIWGLNDTLFSLPAYSYQWYSTTGIISGATNQYFVPSQLGSYYCVVSDSIGCVVNSNLIALTSSPFPIAIWTKGGGITVTPNPFGSSIFVSFKNPIINNATISIHDVIGSTVFETSNLKPQTKIDLSFLAKGIYFYEVRNKDEVIGKGKVVKD